MATQTEAELEELLYPSSDGKPMADNTLQFQWIVTLQGNLAALYRDREDVFVAGDLLWYPVRGQPAVSAAPDTMVAFGRPRGHRRSYLQWREGGVAPQVTFEVRSQNNTDAELEHKLEFYDRHGVDEYYLYDPDEVTLRGWRREDGRLRPIAEMHGWVSPLLGIRFDLSGEELVIYKPDGTRFLTYEELAALQEADARRAEKERRRAEREKKRAERERKHAEVEQKRADEEHRRAECLAARLRALGIDPDAEATAP